MEGQLWYYSDLKEYTERGWCLFEIITALSMQCRIVLGLVCGTPTAVHFEVMQPGLALEELTLTKLLEEWKAHRQSNGVDLASCSSLHSAVERALEALRSSVAQASALLLDRAAECWLSTKDPATLLREMHQALDADLRKNNTLNTTESQQLEAATLTVELNPQNLYEPQAGKLIGAMLTCFTVERDREVVVRLLVNLLVLVRTRFGTVTPREPEVLRALVLEDLRRGGRLDQQGKALLPCEMAPLLDVLVAELACQDAAGKCLAGHSLRLVLEGNPIGPHGVKALCKAAPRLPPLAQLNLTWCGMGIAGGLELAEALGKAYPSLQGEPSALSWRSCAWLATAWVTRLCWR